MRRWGGVVWAVLVLGLASGAGATTLVPLADEQLVAMSDLVVIGTVERIESVLLAGPRVVTRVTLAVDEALKGTPTTSSIVVTEPGGEVAGLEVAVLSAPSFDVGERTLVFLRQRADGSLSTTALALGKYALEAELDGQVVARRRLPVLDARPLDGFAARVAALSVGQPGVRTDGRSGAATEPPTATSVTERFTLTANHRWFEPDCGMPIEYDRAGTESGYDPTASIAAVPAAAAAWTDVATASVVLQHRADIAFTPSLNGGTFDGRNVVMFDDPFAEVTDFDEVQCQGIVAQTQIVAARDKHFPELQRKINGQTFGKIFESDVVMNAGLAGCVPNPLFVAETMTHELGHTVGLGHSSEDPNETDPVLRDATMYFRVHNDDRGASVRADDIEGISFVYPMSALATTPIGQAACEVGLGLLSGPCFGTKLRTAPIRRWVKANRAASKAVSASPAKQKTLLAKVVRQLAAADRAAIRGIPGECGQGMHARLVRYRAEIEAVLATL